MNKKLHMEYPFITSYPPIANCLSAVSTYPRAYEWFYENYVQITAMPSTESGYVDYFTPYASRSCPWFDFWDIPCFLFQQNLKEKYPECLIQLLNQGYYITAVCDQFFVTPSSRYQNIHMPHTTFIFGYDTEEECFYIADFYGRYCYTKLSFSNMYFALSSPCAINAKTGEFNGIQLNKLKDCKWYHFNLNRYLTNVNQFLKCDIGTKEMSYGFPAENFEEPEEYVYGLEVFDYLIDYLIANINNCTVNDIEIRGFHFLYDQSIMIEKTFTFIDQNKLLPMTDVILNRIENLKRQTLLLRNLLLKAKISTNPAIVTKCIDRISQIKENERSIYESILDIGEAYETNY